MRLFFSRRNDRDDELDEELRGHLRMDASVKLAESPTASRTAPKSPGRSGCRR